MRTARDLREELTRALGRDGWTVEVTTGPTFRYVVDFTHPLVPGNHGCRFNSREDVLAHVRQWREIQLVHDAPVRPERHRLLRGLWAAAAWPHGNGAPGAIRSVGYLLFEEGVLTEDEAHWLDAVVEPDPDTDPRLRS
jgi:hypothetical protein